MTTIQTIIHLCRYEKVVLVMHIDRCQAQAIYDSRTAVRSWSEKQRSLLLTQQEKQAIEKLSFGCFGYFALQLGVSDEIDTLHAFPIHQKLYLATTPPDEQRIQSNTSDEQSLLFCDPQFVPLAEESCDLVVLHHLHELVQDPHQCIREAARVVRNEGYLFILGSSLNIHQIFTRIVPRKTNKWQIRLMSRFRLKDWLRLVGFTEQELLVNAIWIEKIIKRLPWTRKPVYWLAHLLPISSFYCIKAQKHATAPLVRLLGARKHKLASMLGNIPEPSASTAGHNKKKHEKAWLKKTDVPDNENTLTTVRHARPTYSCGPVLCAVPGKKATRSFRL